ncbi:MAG TPA: aldehyde dehydrogenase family protein [Thermoleophilaceae bacterium]|nr:aldehyde dehydrogenase family protein [Thermoleophilaceae bacterium]
MATIGVQHHLMFIDGKAVDADSFYEIHSPATEEVVCTVAKGSVEHADAAVESARRAFESGSWSRMPKEERSRIMKAIAERLGSDLEEFTDAEISCNGATRRQAYGFHVGLAAQHFLHFAELAGSYEFETSVPLPAYPTMSTNFIRREPVGVCAAIVPWNFPLVLGIWKVAPALAAGNSIVVKVDEKTPLSLLRLAQVAHECGVPDGVFNLITGDGPDVGARLASHPDVAKVAFTGSTVVGREIMRLASGTVKKVSLELGGKGPVIVLDDADLEIATDGVLFGCMLYSGQICESGTRVYVHDSIHDEFVDRVVQRASTIKLGDPDDLDTDMGPVISERQRDRIVEYLDSGRAEGATVAIGGGTPEGPEFERGYWIEPTIFTDVTNEMQIAREEIFGPVLSVLRYSDLDDAIEQANDSIYGLTAGVWSKDYERAKEVGDQLRAGTVWINNWHMVDPTLPFGGYKQSGVGRELGPDALNEYTEAKHIHLDLTQTRDRHIFPILLSEEPA